ncbi:MAG: LPXTG cell wall anchor domain-containing protein, partial [Enterococcus sp.]
PGETPEETPGETPEETPGERPGEMPDETTEETPKEMPRENLGEILGGTQDKTLEGIPENEEGSIQSVIKKHSKETREKSNERSAMGSSDLLIEITTPSLLRKNENTNEINNKDFLETNEQTDTTANQLPKTGEDSHSFLWMFGMMLVSAAVFNFKKVRKKFL